MFAFYIAIIQTNNHCIKSLRLLTEGWFSYRQSARHCSEALMYRVKTDFIFRKSLLGQLLYQEPILKPTLKINKSIIF
jgi:hypothetical protein